MTLLALNEIGVFPALGGGPRSAADVTEELGSDLRATTLLMNAGVALGLLTKDADGRYANGPEAAAFLVPGGPAFLGGALRYALDVFAPWGGLPAAARTGAAQVPETDYLGGDPARTERFVRGMHGRAMGFAQGVVANLDLGEKTRLLDVAGGSGAYSLLLCGRHSALGATVCDLPGVLDVTRRILAEAGMSERIATHDWDLRSGDALPAGHDVALVSGILHRLDASQARRVLAQVRDALSPGGRIVLADVMLDDTGAGPPAAALFALNMLVTAPGGGAHRALDHVEWLTAEGFAEPEIRPLPPPAMHTLVVARRP